MKCLTYYLKIHLSIVNENTFLSLYKIYVPEQLSLFVNICYDVILLYLVPLEPVKGLRIENCNDNSNRRLYWSLPINNTVNIKGYNITIVPPPSQTSSGCHILPVIVRCHCEVPSFNSNCLEYNVNYSTEIYLVNYGDERERNSRLGIYLNKVCKYIIYNM